MSERYTIAAIYDEEAKTIKFGLATCVPADPFVKRLVEKLLKESRN